MLSQEVADPFSSESLFQARRAWAELAHHVQDLDLRHMASGTRREYTFRVEFPRRGISQSHNLGAKCGPSYSILLESHDRRHLLASLLAIKFVRVCY